MGECLRGELTGIPVGAGVLVVGENGDALGFEAGKKFGRVAFAVEDEGEAVAEGFGIKLLDCGLAGDVVEEAGDDFFFECFLQAGVDGFCDAEEGGSIEGVDPVGAQVGEKIPPIPPERPLLRKSPPPACAIRACDGRTVA